MISSRIVWVVAGLLVSSSAMGDFKPDSSALVKDLEMFTKSEDRMTLVLWLPTEFWRASLEAGGKVAPKEVERFTKELDPYVVLAVADGQMGIAGSVSFAEPDLLKSAVTIEDARGKQLSPLPDDKVSGGVRNLTQMMRPMLGNMLGSLGLHIAFVVFPGVEKGGQRIVDPIKEGTFVVHVGTVVVRYRLPLGSLLPPEVDQQTGESFPGNYRFNPYNGNKLSPAPAGEVKPPADGPSEPTAPAATPDTRAPSRPEQPAPAPGQPSGRRAANDA